MTVNETIFSEDRTYRYTLWREWNAVGVWLDGAESYAMFIGLNPSTADETKDDPTVRRCIGFAKRWGYGTLCMMNLFAYRATDPKVMKGQSNPVGPENDKWLVRCAEQAGIIVAAWGTHGQFIGRDEEVMKLIPNLMCLGKTKYGYPSHPLYISYSVNPTRLVVAE